MISTDQYIIVEEGMFKFTNIKTFKVACSKEMKEASEVLRDANKLYHKKDYINAAKKYKEAKKMYEGIAAAFKSIPETKVLWGHASNWIFLVPFVNIAFVAAVTAASSIEQWESMGYHPKTSKKYWEDCQHRLKMLKDNKNWSNVLVSESDTVDVDTSYVIESYIRSYT